MSRRPRSPNFTPYEDNVIRRDRQMRENVNVTARKLGRTVRQVQARAGRIGAVKGEAPKREVCVDIALTSAEYDWFYSKADGLPISVFCRRILLAEYRKETL